MAIIRNILALLFLLIPRGAFSTEPADVFLLQGGRHEDKYTLALQVKLAPGWMTYWKIPGEAGIAPKPTIGGSTNLRDVLMDFPPPKSFMEGGLKVMGYDNEVIFPLTIVAKDPKKPVFLNLKFDFGVCEKICVPQNKVFSQQLDETPNAKDLQLIKRAQALIPRDGETIQLQGE
jgi:DsbC/DsbD-like thiol-disulfide interchange protein